MLFLINSRGYFKAVCAKLPRHSLHTGYILSIEPSSDLPQLFPWCNTICHRFTPSTVRQMVAVKCSQTSGGISSPGYKLNNSEPCLPFLGHKNTHTHQDVLHFQPIMFRPRGRWCSVGHGASVLSGKAFSGQRQVEEVVMCFLHCVHWDFYEKTDQLKAAAKTITVSLETISV